MSQNSSSDTTAPWTKIQIRLAKHFSFKASPAAAEAVGQNLKEEETKSGNQTNSHASNKFQTLKDIFDHYEIAVVKADNVVYHQTQRSVMLTFHVVTEHKAKNQLLYVNSQTLYKSLYQFNKRLQ